MTHTLTDSERLMAAYKKQIRREFITGMTLIWSFPVWYIIGEIISRYFP